MKNVKTLVREVVVQMLVVLLSIIILSVLVSMAMMVIQPSTVIFYPHHVRFFYFLSI